MFSIRKKVNRRIVPNKLHRVVAITSFSWKLHREATLWGYEAMLRGYEATWGAMKWVRVWYLVSQHEPGMCNCQDIEFKSRIKQDSCQPGCFPMLHAGVRLLGLITKHDDILGDKGPLSVTHSCSQVLFTPVHSSDMWTPRASLLQASLTTGKMIHYTRHDLWAGTRAPNRS